MKPLIGIMGDTTEILRGGPTGIMVEQVEVHLAYARRVAAAGGIPVILPNLEIDDVKEMIDRCNGLLLAGGFDHLPNMNDGCYDSKTLSDELQKTLDEGDERRQKIEGPLIRYAAAKNIPTLGICRGMQAINVAFGGTLHADIASCLPDAAIKHDQNVHRFADVHVVTVSPKHEPVFGRHAFPVNSRHHQAVHLLGNELEIMARCDADRVVEAIAHKVSQMIGVQWHPEDQDNCVTYALFEWLIGQSRA